MYLTGKSYLFLKWVICISLVISSCTKKSEEVTIYATIRGTVNIKNASVLIKSVNVKGDEVNTLRIKSKEGKFSTKVPLFKGGGRIVIIGEAGSSFIRTTKTLKYSRREDVDGVHVNLSLLRLNVKRINVKDGFTMKEEPYIKIRLGKNRFGTSGKERGKVVELSIPSYILKSQSQVEVRYRIFRPSDPGDYRYFPGEENERGKRLVSVGFDYIELVDPLTNKSIFEGVNIKQGQEILRMLRWVDTVQLRKIKSKRGYIDENNRKGGIQVTFYAFDSSKGYWVAAGEGVFVKDPNVNYTSEIFDSILERGCSSRQDCENNGVFWDENEILNYTNVYVVLSIRNPDLAWKNIDYVVPGDPGECLIIARDEKGNPFSIFVEAAPDDYGNIEYVYGFTSASGKVKLRTIVYGNPANAIISYYDPRTGWLNEAICDETNSSKVVFGTDCSCTINIGDIKICKVEGEVLDDGGNPVSNALVEITDAKIYIALYTDVQGKFLAQVPCNRSLNIYIDYFNGPYSFNVNGAVEGSEISDDGSIALVNIRGNVCYAEGRILYDGSPIQGVDVFSYIESVKTDTQGNYKVKVPCSMSGSINIVKSENVGPCNCKIVSYLDFNPNGTIEGDEISDNGSTVKLADFDIAPCYVSGIIMDSLNLINLNYAEVSSSAKLSLSNTRIYISTGKVDNNGNFSVPVLCNIEHSLNVTNSNVNPETYIYLRFSAFAVDGNITDPPEIGDDGKRVTLMNVDVGEGSVSGIVTDSNTNPLVNTSVYIYQGFDTVYGCNLDICLYYHSVTDLSGNYRVGAFKGREGFVDVKDYQCNNEGNKSGLFNINGVTDNNEDSDDGTNVVININGCQQ